MKHLITLLLIISGGYYAQAQTGTPAGTSKLLGKAGSLNIRVTVQSPSAQETPLQIVCLFEYTENDLTNSPPALPAAVNGMVHVDKALKGLITELRSSGKFAGHALETLILIPPPGSIPAKRLLLIGLGNRKDFNPELMTSVGRVGMREALQLGVSSYAHGSDLKDAGIDSPTGTVAVNVIKGAAEALETAQYLNGKQVGPAPSITGLTLLAGPAFFVPTSEAVKTYLGQHPQ